MMPLTEAQKDALFAFLFVVVFILLSEGPRWAIEKDCEALPPNTHGPDEWGECPAPKGGTQK